MNSIHSASVAAGGQVHLARLLGVSTGAVNQWVKGRRPVPVERCAAIERATVGAVTCDDLRPDVAWHRIPDPNWPHPNGRPLIDVAAGHELAEKAAQEAT